MGERMLAGIPPVFVLGMDVQLVLSEKDAQRPSGGVAGQRVPRWPTPQCGHIKTVPLVS